jgi:hypothetical protein
MFIEQSKNVTAQEDVEITQWQLDSSWLIVTKNKITAHYMSVITHHTVSKLTMWFAQTQLKYLQLNLCLNLP